MDNTAREFVSNMNDRIAKLERENAELREALKLALDGLDVAAKQGGPAFIGHVFAGDRIRALLSRHD